MNGGKIIAVLRKYDRTQTELAEKLGTTSQNLSAALKKDDIKTGLVERVSAALDIPLWEFYGGTPVQTVNQNGDGGVRVNGNNNSCNSTDMLEIIRDQQKSISQLSDTISNLTRIMTKR